ncbi:MAG: transposase family protein [Caldilineaceae bacterium SB0662_bin_9]|uniref:Transposase family protein n=1 Tax=Caldilineaceae bacterium SB0662_bin_9 TaxID=2605258 RepID=A0A6B1DWZ8_9CHLR|nr:transposase family protein [Caldilineaceae bacterium SB0662_bin_9]
MEAWSDQPHSNLDCTGSGQDGGFLPPWSPAHGRPASVPLVSLLTKVDNPRRPQARRHALEAILLIVTLVVICAVDNGTEVEFFSLQKQVWLETFLDLPHGIPSHDTFGRVFSACCFRPGWKPALPRGCSLWPQRCRTRLWPRTARRPGVRTTRPGACRPCICSRSCQIGMRLP